MINYNIINVVDFTLVGNKILLKLDLELCLFIFYIFRIYCIINRADAAE